MKKWAFIKIGSRDVECWHYIDNEKEVSRYWYIVDAISRYGWDDVMPVVVNRFGGYYSPHPDDIIIIVESETEPSLEQKNKYMHIVNNPQFDCGWIDSRGNTYSCGLFGHFDLAEELATTLFPTAYTKYKEATPLNAPDEFLLQSGCIKICEGKHHICLWEFVSNEAAQKLDELERKWQKV